MGDIKDVLGTAIDRCGHVPGVPLCEPCIEHALRRAFASGCRAAETRLQSDLRHAEQSVRSAAAEAERLKRLIQQEPAHRRDADGVSACGGVGNRQGRGRDCDLCASELVVRCFLAEAADFLHHPDQQ